MWLFLGLILLLLNNYISELVLKSDLMIVLHMEHCSRMFYYSSY